MTKAIEIFVKALTFLPILTKVVGKVQDASADGKVSTEEAVTITLAALADIGKALAGMLPAAPADIVNKVLAILPVLGDVVLDVVKAASADSAGGKKVTPAEIATIAAEGATKLGAKLAELFAK